MSMPSRLPREIIMPRWKTSRLLASLAIKHLIWCVERAISHDTATSQNYYISVFISLNDTVFWWIWIRHMILMMCTWSRISDKGCKKCKRLVLNRSAGSHREWCTSYTQWCKFKFHSNFLISNMFRTENLAFKMYGRFEIWTLNFGKFEFLNNFW